MSRDTQHQMSLCRVVLVVRPVCAAVSVPVPVSVSARVSVRVSARMSARVSARVCVFLSVRLCLCLSLCPFRPLSLCLSARCPWAPVCGMCVCMCVSVCVCVVDCCCLVGTRGEQACAQTITLWKQAETQMHTRRTHIHSVWAIPEGSVSRSEQNRQREPQQHTTHNSEAV